MRKSGQADLPLHGGRVPPWLYERMSKLGKAILEAMVEEYGTSEVLRRISNPYWFQSLGAVMGMDWHSSGITTSVMGALKKAVNPISKELGLYICGGRGKHSRQTPNELIKYGDLTGIDSTCLVNFSKLAAKVDNTAIQDGFQLYLHSFIVNSKGEWAVVQQGMNDSNRMARRYHWHSPDIRSFTEEPHTGVCGINQGLILNLTAKQADDTRTGILELTREKPEVMVREIQKMLLPRNHEVRVTDLDLKRLGAVLALAYEGRNQDFESLLLTKGLGPKTLRSLTLVSEVIHGTPSRFQDPARFSFSTGGKDGHPFPVQTQVYDETIEQMEDALHRSRIGLSDKQKAFKNLHKVARQLEEGFRPKPEKYKEYVQKERKDSQQFGGRTAFDKSGKSGKKQTGPRQLRLF
mgnify:CR=1 FL=1